MIVSVCALLSVCVFADYEFQMKNLGCDYTIRSTVESTVASNITDVLTTVHGNFRKVITDTVLDDGRHYSTETIMRPDLASRDGYAMEITYSSGAGTSMKEDLIQTTGGISVFKHREPAMFNGHPCFKFFNVPGNAIFADEDGLIWGSQETNDLGEVSTITYKSYDTTEILAGQFTLNNDVTSTFRDNAIITPDAESYARECRNSGGEQTFILKLPELGCDIKMMTEVDFFTNDGNSVTTQQTTITTHGTYMLQTVTDAMTWQTTSITLVRPDKGSQKGMAAAFTYDYRTGQCNKINKQLAMVDFAIDGLVFTHRDEVFYNGFVCYKYYNDSSVAYFMEKSGGLPRGIAIEGESATRFVYYDFSSINSTTFTFSGTELEVCGSEAGETVDSASYSEACNAQIIDESSSEITTPSITESSKTESINSVVDLDAGSIAKASSLISIMMLVVLIA